jgi:hypothetical protein
VAVMSTNRRTVEPPLHVHALPATGLLYPVRRRATTVIGTKAERPARADTPARDYRLASEPERRFKNRRLHFCFSRKAAVMPIAQML